jgi:hypothetical protein
MTGRKRSTTNRRDQRASVVIRIRRSFLERIDRIIASMPHEPSRESVLREAVLRQLGIVDEDGNEIPEPAVLLAS